MRVIGISRVKRPRKVIVIVAAEPKSYDRIAELQVIHVPKELQNIENP